MQWQLEGDRPIYQQLVDQIMMQIVSGQRKAGDKVPAVRELAAEAGVNPNTMQRAMAQSPMKDGTQNVLREIYRAAGVKP